ncbi:uncharacterized protein LOC132925915 [Rhopalosiphum padi]|uniref:uncharacterized protein LOC132925915 n=1 Tax=Rhopalosiphum padi TaxID=40932 RepID=UPI00298D6C53|nr:uncharacterized protein LOC132925915 [Rhopalosiphum padi]
MIENPEHKMVHLKKTLSYELGIGQSTIYNTILEYQRTKTVSSPNKTKVRKQLTEKVDEFDKYGIRRKVHQFWHDRDTPTLDKILVSVNEDNGLPNFSRTSLFRLLKSMDFVYMKRGRNSGLIEKSEIILWRRRYLKDIKRYREEGRPIYFLDETWVNAGDVNSKVWVDKTVTSARVASSEGLSTGAINPTGKGKRLIVSHIGSEDGFVPGGLLCFESKKNTQDYHDEMNGDSFRDWLEGVLPKLKDNAVIVMDNAPYHSVKIEKCPTTNWRKADIIAWLQSKGKQVDNTMLVIELLDEVKKLKPLYNNYVIDEMVKANNKIVLRLPPYHCELNAIELAWAIVKKHVKDNNKTFKLQDIKHLLVEGVNKVSPDMWKNFVGHVIKEEEKAWSLDNVVEDFMSAENQPCVLTIGQSDSDDDDEDFRYLSDTD